MTAKRLGLLRSPLHSVESYLSGAAETATATTTTTTTRPDLAETFLLLSASCRIYEKFADRRILHGPDGGLLLASRRYIFGSAEQLVSSARSFALGADIPNSSRFLFATFARSESMESPNNI